MISPKKEYGNFGEDLAVKYLKKRKYKVIARNFTTRSGEIDIVAIETKSARKCDEDYKRMSDEMKKEDVLVFVEVKTRKDVLYGNPYEAVDKEKQKRYYKTAFKFIAKNHLQDYQIRYDIIEVVGVSVKNHFKNAF